MTEFEPLTSGFGSDRSASSATTTAIKYVILPVVNWRFVTAPTSTKTICASYVFIFKMTDLAGNENLIFK